MVLANDQGAYFLRLRCLCALQSVDFCTDLRGAMRYESFPGRNIAPPR